VVGRLAPPQVGWAEITSLPVYRNKTFLAHPTKAYFLIPADKELFHPEEHEDGLLFNCFLRALRVLCGKN
jgi:hypothetical protein